MQHDPGDFGPIRAVRFGIEQAQINDQQPVAMWRTRYWEPLPPVGQISS